MYNNLYDYFKNNRNQYVVKKGDSLYSIAKKLNTTVDKLMKENGLNGYLIYPNQILIIPKKKETNGIYFEEYITKENDTLDSLIKNLGISIEELVLYNKLENLELKENQELKFNYDGLTEFNKLKMNNVDFETLVYKNKDIWLTKDYTLN